MEIRQQVILNSSEIKDIITEHLKRKGIRLHEESSQIRNNGTFFSLTMTEEEMYVADTQKILEQPLSVFELKNSNLKKKLLKKMKEGVSVSTLLKKRFSHNPKREDIANNNLINDLFENSYKKRDKITSEEEDEIISAFGELGIKVNKRHH